MGGPTPAVVPLMISWVCLALASLYSNAIERSLCLPYVLTRAWTVAALTSSVFAILQYLGWATWFAPFISYANTGEAFANLRQRNQFATLTNIGLAVTLIGAMRCEASFIAKRLSEVSDVSDVSDACHKSAETTQYVKWAYVFSALLVTANAASASRTGLLQLLGLLAAGCLYSRTNRSKQGNTMQRLVLTCLVSYLVASVVLPLLIGLELGSSGIQGRFQEGASACQSRLTLWSNVLHLIAQKPWTGWGWGELDYAHFITLYPGMRFCDILDNAHNLPLHLAVELGIPAAAVFCVFCVWLIARERPWQEQSPARQLAWTILALIALHSLLEYPLWYGPFQIAVVLCIYLLWRIPASWRVASDGGCALHASPAKLSRAISAIALLVIAGCAYAAWDYWRISQIYTAPPQRAPAYKDDTLNKVQGSWLFSNQVRFAELSITPLTQDNAGHLNALSKGMLHFSPEPQVVKKLIESALLLGRDEEAAFYRQRFKAAFPNAEL